MNSTKLMTLLSVAAVAYGCSVSDENTSLDSDGHVQKAVDCNVKPIDTALQSLEDFLAQNYPGTKSHRKMTVGRYYGDSPATKSDGEQGESSPLAYIVNFDDGNGFAVLGARKELPDIVAVTESGSIDTLTLEVTLSEFRRTTIESNTEDAADSIGFYCAEDDDFYCADSTSGAFVTALLKRGLEIGGAVIDPGIPGPIDDDTPVILPGNPGTPQRKYKTCSPLMNYSWGQGYPYNIYCKKNGKQASTGCSNTALSMMLACNGYPNRLKVNGFNINWDSLKSTNFRNPQIDTAILNQVGLLFAMNFYSVKPHVNKYGTLITPQRIKRQMDKLQYKNTKKYSAHKFNSKMLEATSYMLGNRLPVFISAIPKKWKYGHSWVIDGACYTSEDKYVVHCNFGWSGQCNGYFSVSCINPGEAVSYDDEYISQKEKDENNYTYTWHFRLITYELGDDCSLEWNML